MKAVGPAHIITRLAGLAMAYFLAGRLALLLAIPPGYAAPMWPAAAIALLASLRYGATLGFFVTWLGSFAVNASASWPESLAGPELIRALLLPASIGLGAALGAVVGASLIRRHIGHPHDLDSLPSVAGFLLLGGPLACTLSPSIGIGSLYFNGLIPSANVPFNWMTWWIGDSLGVLLFSIVLLPFFHPAQGLWLRRRRLLPAVLLSTAALMILVFIKFSAAENATQQARFQDRAVDLQYRLQTRMEQQAAVLLGAAGHVTGDLELNRDEFRHYAELVHAHYPGLQALSWNPIVDESEREAYERRARADGLSDFQFTEQIDGQMQTAGQRPRYVPVYFLEPLAGNRAALGFDLLSNPARQQAIQSALRSRQAAATPPITLVQETGQQMAAILMFPVFRQDRAVGLVSGIFRVNDWVNQALAYLPVHDLLFQISASRDGSMPIYAAAKPLTQNPFSITLPLRLADQTWWLKVAADQHYLASNRSYVPWSILAGGLLLASLLGVFLLTSSGAAFRNETARQDLQAMLDDLLKTQNELVETRRQLALGTMVSGLAHELNTPLGIAITAGSSLPVELEQIQDALAKESLSRSDLQTKLKRWQEASEICNRNIQRAAELVKTFKSVAAERGVHDINRLALDELIRETMNHLLKLKSSSAIPISIDYALEPVQIESIAGSIMQILNNLYENCQIHAFDAAGGTIRISLQAHKQGALLRFEDDGKGIPSDDLSKIFEPFYTTRRGRGGTGLGLHILHNLVTHQLGGQIQVQSTPGEGCCFEIWLPARLPSGEDHKPDQTETR